MNRSIALRLAILAVGAIGATAMNGLDAQNKAPGAYAVLDFSAVNSPDAFKILPSKTGDFDAIQSDSELSVAPQYLFGLRPRIVLTL